MSYIAVILRKSVNAPYHLWISLFFQYQEIIKFYCNKSIVRTPNTRKHAILM